MGRVSTKTPAELVRCFGPEIKSARRTEDMEKAKRRPVRNRWMHKGATPLPDLCSSVGLPAPFGRSRRELRGLGSASDAASDSCKPCFKAGKRG